MRYVDFTRHQIEYCPFSLWVALINSMSDQPAPIAVNTYHCVCTTLILSVVEDLDSLPTRNDTADGALILPLPSIPESANHYQNSALHNIVTDAKPIIIRREDGFERRILLKCYRCDSIIGYRLDDAHFHSPIEAESIIYILPGGLVDTEGMKVGKAPSIPTWAQAT